MTRESCGALERKPSCTTEGPGAIMEVVRPGSRREEVVTYTRRQHEEFS